MADPIVGVNYFNHQFLRRGDFERAREYHVERHQQHTRFLHRPGVVRGLEVRPGAVSVSVTHGVALDERGQEVELQTTTAVNPVRLRVQTGANTWEESDVQVGGELVLELRRFPADVHTAYVAIRRGVHPHEPTTDVGLTGDTRLAERAEVQVSIALPDAAAGYLHLATITRNADGVPFTSSTSSGALAGAVLADDSVTSAKIAEADTAAGQDTNSGTGIKTGHIKNAAVTTPKLADDAVTRVKIADDAISSAKIAEADAGSTQDASSGTGIKTAHLKDAAVTEAKIAGGAVTEAKIGAGAVTEGKIGTGAVTTGKIANDAVTEIKMGAGAVTETKLGAGAVTEGKIATGAVTTGKLANDAVTTGKIANDAVTEIKIANLAVTETKLGTGAVTTGKIANDAVTSGKIANDAVTEGKIGAGAVTETKIGTGAVTTGKIANVAVTSGKLADAAVVGAKIAADAVTADKIAAGAVGTSELADLAVTTGKLANLAVTTGKIANQSITQEKLAPGVGGGGLSPGAVKYEHVAQGAVSVRQMASQLVAAGFVTIAPYSAASIPPLPLNAGFILPNIWIEQIVGFPGTNVQHQEVRLWYYETFVALYGSQVGDPWGSFGRQWYVYSQSQYPITVGYRFYRVEEVNPTRPIGP